jgi:predicted ABC-type sugar transport system permease subunit
VAGLAFGLVFGVAMAWLDSPALYVITGACFATSGVAGLLSGGAFFIQSKSWSWMAHLMCLPILGWGLSCLIIGVGRLAGWLD